MMDACYDSWPSIRGVFAEMQYTLLLTYTLVTLLVAKRSWIELQDTHEGGHEPVLHFCEFKMIWAVFNTLIMCPFCSSGVTNFELT